MTLFSVLMQERRKLDQESLRISLKNALLIILTDKTLFDGKENVTKLNDIKKEKLGLKVMYMNAQKQLSFSSVCCFLHLM